MASRVEQYSRPGRAQTQLVTRTSTPYRGRADIKTASEPTSAPYNPEVTYSHYINNPLYTVERDANGTISRIYKTPTPYKSKDQYREYSYFGYKDHGPQYSTYIPHEITLKDGKATEVHRSTFRPFKTGRGDSTDVYVTQRTSYDKGLKTSDAAYHTSYSDRRTVVLPSYYKQWDSGHLVKHEGYRTAHGKLQRKTSFDQFGQPITYDTYYKEKRGKPSTGEFQRAVGGYIKYGPTWLESRTPGRETKAFRRATEKHQGIFRKPLEGEKQSMREYLAQPDYLRYRDKTKQKKSLLFYSPLPGPRYDITPIQSKQTKLKSFKKTAGLYFQKYKPQQDTTFIPNQKRFESKLHAYTYASHQLGPLGVLIPQKGTTFADRVVALRSLINKSKDIVKEEERYGTLDKHRIRNRLNKLFYDYHLSYISRRPFDYKATESDKKRIRRDLKELQQSAPDLIRKGGYERLWRRLVGNNNYYYFQNLASDSKHAFESSTLGSAYTSVQEGARKGFNMGLSTVSAPFIISPNKAGTSPVGQVVGGVKDFYEMTLIDYPTWAPAYAKLKFGMETVGTGGKNVYDILTHTYDSLRYDPKTRIRTLATMGMMGRHMKKHTKDLRESQPVEQSPFWGEIGDLGWEPRTLKEQIKGTAKVRLSQEQTAQLKAGLQRDQLINKAFKIAKIPDSVKFDLSVWKDHPPEVSRIVLENIQPSGKLVGSGAILARTVTKEGLKKALQDKKISRSQYDKANTAMDFDSIITKKVPKSVKKVSIDKIGETEHSIRVKGQLATAKRVKKFFNTKREAEVRSAINKLNDGIDIFTKDFYTKFEISPELQTIITEAKYNNRLKNKGTYADVVKVLLMEKAGVITSDTAKKFIKDISFKGKDIDFDIIAARATKHSRQQALAMYEALNRTFGNYGIVERTIKTKRKGDVPVDPDTLGATKDLSTGKTTVKGKSIIVKSNYPLTGKQTTAEFKAEKTGKFRVSRVFEKDLLEQYRNDMKAKGESATEPYLADIGMDLSRMKRFGNWLNKRKDITLKDAQGNTVQIHQSFIKQFTDNLDRAVGPSDKWSKGATKTLKNIELGLINSEKNVKVKAKGARLAGAQTVHNILTHTKEKAVLKDIEKRQTVSIAKNPEQLTKVAEYMNQHDFVNVFNDKPITVHTPQGPLRIEGKLSSNSKNTMAEIIRGRYAGIEKGLNKDLLRQLGIRHDFNVIKDAIRNERNPLRRARLTSIYNKAVTLALQNEGRAHIPALERSSIQKRFRHWVKSIVPVEHQLYGVTLQRPLDYSIQSIKKNIDTIHLNPRKQTWSKQDIINTFTNSLKHKVPVTSHHKISQAMGKSIKNLQQISNKKYSLAEAQSIISRQYSTIRKDVSSIISKRNSIINKQIQEGKLSKSYYQKTYSRRYPKIGAYRGIAGYYSNPQPYYSHSPYTTYNYYNSYNTPYSPYTTYPINPYTTRTPEEHYTSVTPVTNTYTHPGTPPGPPPPPPLPQVPPQVPPTPIPLALQDDHQRVWGWQPVLFNEQGDQWFGDTYSTHKGAQRMGMMAVDHSAYNRFRLRHVQVNPSDIRKAQPYRKGYKFRQLRRNTFVEKRAYRFDTSYERKGSFDIYPYVFARRN